MTEVNVRQYLTACDNINLLRNSLQVIQNQSDAVRGIDDGALRRVQLSGGTAHLSQKQYHDTSYTLTFSLYTCLHFNIYSNSFECNSFVQKIKPFYSIFGTLSVICTHYVNHLSTWYTLWCHLKIALISNYSYKYPFFILAVSDTSPTSLVAPL